MDCTSFSAAQIAECTPSRMKKTTKILQVINFNFNQTNLLNIQILGLISTTIQNTQLLQLSKDF